VRLPRRDVAHKRFKRSGTSIESELEDFSPAEEPSPSYDAFSVGFSGQGSFPLRRIFPGGAVVHSLNSAGSWGTWDMFGGGLIATAVKQSRIDDARDQVQEVQALALRFERELTNVQFDIDVPLQFNAFTKVADYFFDNLITGWIVNSRIDESRNSARTAYAKVEEIMAQLLQRFSDEKSQTNAAEEERRTIIEEA